LLKKKRRCYTQTVNTCLQGPCGHPELQVQDRLGIYKYLGWALLIRDNHFELFKSNHWELLRVKTREDRWQQQQLVHREE
jgi:hypothetical protein